MPKKANGKEKRPYPSYDQRIEAAEKKIAQLQELVKDRTALVAKTEKQLNDRKIALTKSEADLKKVMEKRDKLVDLKNRPEKAPAAKLSPEARRQQRVAAITKAREVRKAKKAEMDALMNAIHDSGKSVDEVLAEIKKA